MIPTMILRFSSGLSVSSLLTSSSPTADATPTDPFSIASIGRLVKPSSLSSSSSSSSGRPSVSTTMLPRLARYRLYMNLYTSNLRSATHAIVTRNGKKRSVITPSAIVTTPGEDVDRMKYNQKYANTLHIAVTANTRGCFTFLVLSSGITYIQIAIIMKRLKLALPTIVDGP